MTMPATARARSSSGLPLVDLLADPYSVQYPSLRGSDVCHAWRTYKQAWRRIHHQVLSGTIVTVGAPHIPPLRWCFRQVFIISLHVANLIGSTGYMPFFERCIAECDRSISRPLGVQRCKRGRRYDCVPPAPPAQSRQAWSPIRRC